MNACKVEYEPRGDAIERCTYCGSITPAKFLELLVTEGVEYSGSDWKYGWPHKYYLRKDGTQFKFYTIHLLEATEDMLIVYNRLAERTFGIFFYHGPEGQLQYRSPYGPGQQASGTIQLDRYGRPEPCIP